MKDRASLPRTFASLRFRNYRLYFISQTVSNSGTAMQQVALAWLVLQLTGSGTALGIVLAVQYLPVLLLGPIGGVVADRFEKRRLLVITQSLSGAQAFVLGILTLTHVVELWMVYPLAATLGAVTAIDNPTRQSFVMDMVGPNDISNSVTLNAVNVNVAKTIGPAIGGLLIATLGVGEAFIFNGVSYLAIIAALLLIRTEELHTTARLARRRSRLRDGLGYAWSEPTIRTTLLMVVLIGTFTFEFPTTMPMFSEFTFDAGSAGLAVMMSILGAGAVLGGLGVASLGPATPARYVAVTAALGVAVGATAMMPTIWLVFVLLLFVGVAAVATQSQAVALLQLRCEDQFRGRVMGLYIVAHAGSTAVGGLMVGWVGDRASPRAALMLGALAACGASILGRARLERDRSAMPPTDVDLDNSVRLE